MFLLYRLPIRQRFVSFGGLCRLVRRQTYTNYDDVFEHLWCHLCGEECRSI